MPSEDTKILEFNQYQKFDKALFINFSDLECIMKKVDWCKNHPQEKWANIFHRVFQFLQ